MSRFYLMLNREVMASLHSFGFYALLALVCAITAFGFGEALETQGNDMNRALAATYSWLLSLTMIITPLLTMGAFAEEKRSGTLEMLMTAPVKDGEVVLAKFFGSTVIFSAFLAPVWILNLILWKVYQGDPDWGQLTSMTIGLFHLGMLFLAVGILASAMSTQQLWAALLAVVMNVALTLVGTGRFLFESTSIAATTLAHVSLDLHIRTAMSGIVDLRQVLVQVSIIVLVLFWTVRVVEARKWN